MTDAEYDLLSPVPSDQMKVWCNKCNHTVQKRSIFKHIHNHHPELEEESWNWAIKGDYNWLKHKTLLPDDASKFNLAWSRKAMELEQDWALQYQLHEAEDSTTPFASAEPSVSTHTENDEDWAIAYQVEHARADGTPVYSMHEAEDSTTPFVSAEPYVSTHAEYDEDWAIAYQVEHAWGDGTPVYSTSPNVNICPSQSPGGTQTPPSPEAPSATPTPQLENLSIDHPSAALQRVAPTDIVTVPALQASEFRILSRNDQVVESFNEILQAGLGEVQAKYEVAFPLWFIDFDPQVDGKNFPNHLLSDNANLEVFKLTMFEFRGLESKTASHIMRDISRFFGCFQFSNEAGQDLPNLMVSIFKHGLLKPLLLSKLWHAKPTYLMSLKWSLKHLLDFLENKERIVRSIGGLTTALSTIGKAIDYELAVMVKNKRSKRKGINAQNDSRLIDKWVGSDVYKEMVLNAFQGLFYIKEHKHDVGFLGQVGSLLGKPILSHHLVP